jgi:Arc/MetJ family transcription regulator
MQLNTAIDDRLWHQALQISGLTTPQEVLELALRVLVQTPTPRLFGETGTALQASDPPRQLNLAKLKADKARFAHQFPPSVIEPIDQPSVYQGPPLTLEDMRLAIEEEAGHHL